MADKKTTNGAAETQPALSKNEDFVLKYKNAIICAIAALVIIVGAVIFFSNQKAAKLQKAQLAMQIPDQYMQAATAQLEQSTDLFDSHLFEQALKGDSLGSMGFLKIADEYSSTKAGNLANLYAGLCYAHMDQWEEAVKFLEKYDDADDILISPAALGALGNAYAHVNQPDKAVKTLSKAAEKADNILLSPIYYIQAGEILESQGNKAEALKMYQKVKQYESINQSSPYVELIDEYIQRVSE